MNQYATKGTCRNFEEPIKLQLLKDEYFQIQKVIEDFDGRAIQIKAWSVSFSLVALGGAFASDSSSVCLISSLSAFLFWIIESYWKTFQYAYYDRSGQIERYFDGTGKDLDPMQIGSAWYKRWKSGGIKRLLRIMIWPHVALPHCIVILLGIILFISVQIGFIKI